MDDNLIELLSALDVEIEKKSFELRQRKRQRLIGKMFFLGCIFMMVVPCILVFLGVSFITLMIPVVLFSLISISMLIPLILNSNLGGMYNGKTGCIN